MQKVKYIVEDKKGFKDLDIEILKKIREEKLPLVCLSGIQSGLPLDFNYLVIDSNNKVRAKFIDIEDAKEYADFLADI